MGLLLAWDPSVALRPWIVPVFLVANACLVAHVFGLNDWAGITADQQDSNKADRTFLALGVSRAQMGVLVASLGVASLSLFSLLSWSSVLLAAAVVGLSLAYSHPILGGKGMPIVSSLLHLAGGTVHFLLGYGVARPIDAGGLLLGLYFGLIFAAGHLSQEVADHDADRRAGLRTAAVRAGKRRVFVASFALFTLSVGLALALGLGGIAPPLLAVAVAAVYPVHGLSFRHALRAGLTFPVVDRYRTRYRLLYALVGVAVALSLPWRP